MAGSTISKAAIIQFSDRLHIASQQGSSWLRPYVNVIPMSGKSFAYDGLGQVEAREVVGRIQPAQFDDIEHLRRKISRRRFVVNLPYDGMDVEAMLVSPSSEYPQACMNAINRVFDKVGVDAAFADVKTGEDFETTVTAANDNVDTIDATGGLTYEKIREIMRKFRNNEVGNQKGEKFLMLITADEEERLMLETELVSGDFSRNYVIDKGEMVNAGGFDLLRFGASVNSPILSVASTTRNCIAMSSRGLVYGMSKEMDVKVQERSDYIDTTQVQTTIILGAVRTEGKLLKKIQTTVS